MHKPRQPTIGLLQNIIEKVSGRVGGRVGGLNSGSCTVDLKNSHASNVVDNQANFSSSAGLGKDL